MTDGTRIVTIPRHDPVDAVTMGGIVRDAGLTPETFRALSDSELSPKHRDPRVKLTKSGKA